MRITHVLFIVFALLFGCKDAEKKSAESTTNTNITTYYLIRHAEKDRSDPENSDPSLTEIGKARAQQWARYFDTIALDAVYSTKYLRTYMTAAPTAERKQLEILPYDPNNLNDSLFQASTKNKAVLVVGHSNTTPALVNKILGLPKYQDLDDNDNSTLFVVEKRKTFTVVDERKVPLNQ